MPKTPGATEIPVGIRGAIVALRLFTQKSWIEISQDLFIRPDTAQRLFSSIQKRASDPLDSQCLFSVLENAERSGRPEKIPEGSKTSQLLGELAVKDKEHWEKPWPKIAEEAGVVASRSTIEKVMHKHHNFVRAAPARKPPLNLENRESRFNFAHWAIKMPPECFVFSDESWFEINVPRKKVKVTRVKGGNPYDYTQHEYPTTQGWSLMVWGCIAYGYKGPLFIWEKETADEKVHYGEMVQIENQAKRARELERRKLARHKGTEEFKILSEINANVRQLDKDDPLPSGRRRQKRRPEWEFKELKVERGERDKGGIDWVLYREKILRPLLYPFIQKIERETGRQMWLVEDNAGSHSAAQRLGEEERKNLGIRTCNWPANSPDINKIEPLWDQLKDSMAEHELPGQSKAQLQNVRQLLQMEWERLDMSLINRLCLDFKNKLELVIKNKGNNNFRG